MPFYVSRYPRPFREVSATRPRHGNLRGIGEMAQAARDSRLETRTARLRLPLGQRHFKSIGKGLTLIYRRTAEGFGTWTAKLALPGGKYTLRTLGGADDYQEANDADVFSFGQAQDRARALADEAKANEGVLVKPSSVKE